MSTAAFVSELMQKKRQVVKIVRKSFDKEREREREKDFSHLDFDK